MLVIHGYMTRIEFLLSLSFDMPVEETEVPVTACLQLLGYGVWRHARAWGFRLHVPASNLFESMQVTHPMWKPGSSSVPLLQGTASLLFFFRKEFGRLRVYSTPFNAIEIESNYK